MPTGKTTLKIPKSATFRVENANIISSMATVFLVP